MTFRALLDIANLKKAIAPGNRMLVGVSGGADSVALLLALAEVAPEIQSEIIVVHVNHGLRPEALDEQEFVAGLCVQLNIQLHVRSLSPEAAKPSGGSAEGHWRKLRYEQFEEVMRETSCHVLALGHTADDLAETFLFHLARGTGVDGLIFHFESDRHGLRIVRPLWKILRTDIESALRAAGQSWMDDPSNTDTRHSRNLIRHEVMPVLQKINPAATAAIVRASEAIAEVTGERPTIQATPVIAPATDLKPPSHAGILPLEQFLVNDSARDSIGTSVREFVQRCMAKINSTQTDQARRMISNENTGLVSLADSKTLVITRQFAWIIDRREPNTLTLATEHVRRFGGLAANISKGTRLEPTATFPALDGITYTITIANAPGDSIIANRVAGARAGSTPLKKLLNQHRVPWYLRDWQVYVVAPDRKTVLAAIGVDPAFSQAIARHSRVRLDISISPPLNDA